MLKVEAMETALCTRVCDAGPRPPSYRIALGQHTNDSFGFMGLEHSDDPPYSSSTRSLSRKGEIAKERNYEYSKLLVFSLRVACAADQQNVPLTAAPPVAGVGDDGRRGITWLG